MRNTVPPSFGRLALFFPLLATLIAGCTSVKTISEYKLAENQEAAVKNVEKSLNFLADKSDTADYRAQLYDSMALLARKFQLKSANPQLYGRVLTALDGETRKVQVDEKVPPADVMYLRRLAVVKIGELGELATLLALLQANPPQDPLVASTALGALFDDAAQLKKEPELALPLFQAADALVATAAGYPAVADKIPAQRRYLNELIDLPAATGILSSLAMRDPDYRQAALDFLDWDYTLVKHAAGSEAVAGNLAALAALGFPADGGERPLPQKARGVLAQAAPLYGLERTVNRTLADLEQKKGEYPYAREIFSYFARRPYPTDPDAGIGAKPLAVPGAGTREAVLTRAIKLAVTLSAPDFPKELRDGGYGMLLEVDPAEFSRTAARRAPFCRRDEALALEMLSLLKAAAADPENSARPEVLQALETETARFAAAPFPSVLDATAGMLLETAPDRLIAGLEGTLDGHESYAPELKARQGELLLNALARLTRRDNSLRGLDLRQLASFYEQSGGEARSKLLRFVAGRDPAAALKLNHELLSGKDLKKPDPDLLYYANSQAAILAASAADLSEDGVRLAVADLYAYLAAEPDEEYALQVARVLASVDHPLARCALRELAASGGARSASLAVLLQAAAGRIK